ncbi:serine/threonine-protein kinase [Rubripirellula reticaptiva]|uniref:non-specific serine/threonine protein kinase n=1 Tax=Rubripirellula reticaptiva TaxID=2528013 RepID=A0A5C6EN71_9BACT|nr:serine/threonine-protein kinase [Rubripirellula reticaptiva]TWU51183.1 Serine/threonine-protein kinase PknB [Rubripirellula reticaptiva]
MTDAKSTASSASLVGTRIGDYQVLRKLGRGGMADVYAARHLSLGRDVALKVLRSNLAGDKDYVERFRREARAAAKLNHPNIVQVFDVGTVKNSHYIAQELIDGENLRESLERRGVLSPEEAVRVLIDVASALEMASDAGITHRDIKPENIMRSHQGIVKVADFGLARLGNGGSDVSRADLTQAGLTLGTPRYMSPEQIQGQAVDARSDLYSLGVSVYHLLAGRPPFEADDPLALAVMHLHETPMPLDRARNRRGPDGNPDLPEWLIAVVSRLMNKLPSERFQSPGELLDAVRNEASTSTLDGFGVGTAAATIRLQRVTDQSNKNRRRKNLRIAAAILLPITCIAGTIWAANAKSTDQLSTLLKPATVLKADTVQQQYLTAVTRNDEAGWNAVSEHFPPTENSTNANYHAKSKLQLARMLIENDQPERADAVLVALLSDPSVERVFQVLAWVDRCRLLNDRGATKELEAAKGQLQALFADVKQSNPTSLDLIQRVVPESDRARWEIN